MAYLLRRRKLGRTSCREIAARSQRGIRAFRNDQHIPRLEEDRMVFRWGCTSNTPAEIVVNEAIAIHRVSDKTGFRRVLQAEELCPRTWFDQRMDRGNIFPLVVRPQFHHQGRKLFVCNNQRELDAAIARCGAGWYASELIKKVAEYRVFVVSGRAVCVARKYPGNPNQIAWNVFQGGRFENVRWDEWPLKAVKNSIKAFALSGLDFGGVDVMVDAERETYILEINAAPSLTSPYRQDCFAKAFDYIIQHGKKTIPLIEAKGGYAKFIHPAIAQNAR
jgi:glutathione synthase/RimK-type ligase-like ATP-grasp enzyme